MRYDIQDKVALVMDYGSYIEVAERLAKDYAKVYYFNPMVYNGYPQHDAAVIAMNVPGVIKVGEWASVIDEVDLVYFPDSHEPYLQNFFRNMGKAVFGSVFACNLEHDRALLNETLKGLGLPVASYYTPKGLDELEQFLLQKKELYIKSSLRGDMETWLHTDPRISKRELKRMRHEMGLYENKEMYIVQEPIDGIGEVGIDPLCIDGVFADQCPAGIEIKDAGYVCKMVYYQTLPAAIKTITDKLGPIFKDCGYRGHYSNEIIISKDKRGFLLDNTCRVGQPPGSIMMEMYTNYSEIVWEVANGIFPNIQYENAWGVQLIIKSDMAENQPAPIIIPEEVRSFVKIKNLSFDEDGTAYYSPLGGMKMREIGACVGLGATIDEAEKNAKQVAKSIEGLDIYVKTDAIDKAKKSLEKLSKAGVPFI